MNWKQLTAAFGKYSKACDIAGTCFLGGEPRGFGEWSGDTGPPGAKDDTNDFLVGERGDVELPPGGDGRFGIIPLCWTWY